MNARNKKYCLVCGFLLGALLAGFAWLLFNLTRNVEPQWSQDPNPVEAYEASRKIRILANTNSPAKGFVRLSEVEINSYLQENLGAQTNSLPSSLDLQQAGIRLDSKKLTFICWTRQNFLGRQLPLVYQRNYSVLQTTNISSLKLEGIKIGRLEIPKLFWPSVEDFFSRMNTRFEERRNWLAQLPAVHLALNEITRNPEVRLYNFDPSPPLR